mmetsp:Transcript_31278/g.99769  ORF Transcript_31278/g.99769 Transcript_31278/m.99769 type:complete len:216 (-) Transcript_31278:602-1249(-)
MAIDSNMLTHNSGERRLPPLAQWSPHQQHATDLPVQPGNSPSELQPFLVVHTRLWGDEPVVRALGKHGAHPARDVGECAFLGDRQRRQLVHHGPRLVLGVAPPVERDLLLVHLAVVDERVDDGEHILLPQVHLGDLAARHEFRDVGEARAPLLDDVAVAHVPQHLDELRVELVLGVPRPPRDLSARLELEEHVDLAVLVGYRLDRLDELARLKHL